MFRFHIKDYIGQRVCEHVRLKLDFPTDVQNAGEKVRYTLGHEGTQCFCNLRLLTGLSGEDLFQALEELRDKGVVIFLGGPFRLFSGKS